MLKISKNEFKPFDDSKKMSLGSALSSSSSSSSHHQNFFDSNKTKYQDPDEHLVSEVNWTRLPVKDPSQDSFFIKFKTLSDDPTRTGSGSTFQTTTTTTTTNFNQTNQLNYDNNSQHCNGFVLFLTNMKSVWKKRYEKAEIEKDISNYCKGLNMSASSIVQQIEQFLLEYSSRSVQENNHPKIELLGAARLGLNSESEQYVWMDSIQSVHASAIRKQWNCVVLKIKALLPTAVNIPLPFYWEIHCERIEPSTVMTSENYGESIDHSYILIQDFEDENSQTSDKKKRKRKNNEEDDEVQQDNQNSAKYFYENGESLFICNQIIRPLLGIVHIQSSQIDQLKSLCLKKEQELISYRQMYSSSSGSNAQHSSSDILDVLDRILKPSKTSNFNELCDISFGLTTTSQQTLSSQQQQQKLNDEDSTNHHATTTNILLRQLYSQFMKSSSSDNCTRSNTNAIVSKKKKTSAEPLSATSTSSKTGLSQNFDVGGDLLPEEVYTGNQLQANESHQTQPQQQQLSQPSVVNLSDSAPILQNTLDITTHSIPTSQCSEYVETEEEKRRRQEIEEKLNEKRKKKQANEQKNKIKKAFM